MKQYSTCSPSSRSVDVHAFAVHPGGIVTDLLRHMTDDELQGYGLKRDDAHGSSPTGNSVAEGGFFKTLEQGAATSIWAAVSPQLSGMGGVYREDADIAALLLLDSTGSRGVCAYAVDPVAAERLWDLSEELTGVKL